MYAVLIGLLFLIKPQKIAIDAYKFMIAHHIFVAAWFESRHSYAALLCWHLIRKLHLHEHKFMILQSYLHICLILAQHSCILSLAKPLHSFSLLFYQFLERLNISLLIRTEHTIVPLFIYVPLFLGIGQYISRLCLLDRN